MRIECAFNAHLVPSADAPLGFGYNIFGILLHL